mgnify:CR=1 FL=1
MEDLKETLVAFAQQKGIDVIFGTDEKFSVKEYDKVVIPEDNKEELLKLIKERGLYDEFSSLNYFKFVPKVRKKELDDDILGLTTIEKDYKVTISKRKD